MPNYQLEKNTPQFGFFYSRAPLQVFGGAFANGKTTALAVKALRLARMYPGSNGLLARSTYPKLNDTLRKVFLEWCPAHWIRKRPSQEDNTCYLTNGSVINFRYIAQRGKSSADGQTSSNLLSATYDWIGVDQIEDPEIVGKDLDDLFGRLRGQTPYRPPDGEDDPDMPNSGPRWIMVTCNPSNGWFFKDVVQPYIAWRDKGVKTEKLLYDEHSGKPIIELFEGSTYTNAKNLTPDYIRNLEAKYKGQMRERYLLGKWAAFEGLVHPDFSTEKNVLTRAQMEGYLAKCLDRHVRIRVLEGYDFGQVSPTCYIYAFIDDSGRVFLLDGFYKTEFNYQLHPQAIYAIRAKYNMLRVTEPIIADPAIFQRQVLANTKQTTGTTIKSLLEDMGLEMRAGSNAIISGLAKINSYIAGTFDTPHIVTNEKPGTMLYVCSDLEWFMDEIFSYYWKRNPQGQHIDEPVDANDHAMNTIKYMLSKLPEPSEVVVPKNKLPPKWSYWHEIESRAHYG